MTRALALLSALWLAASPVRAHDRSLSSSWWTLDARGAEVELSLRALDLSALEAAGVSGALQLGGLLPRYVQSRLVLRDSHGDCAPVADSFTAQRAEQGWSRLRWRVRCAEAPEALRSVLLAERPGHLHWARIAGRREVLSAARPELRWGGVQAPALSGVGWVRSGVQHVWTGWDHLLFLLGLLLVAARAGSTTGLVAVVSGFTLGHALTLLGTALGVVAVDGVAVELWIALSIALVGCEACLTRPALHRSAAVASGVALLGVASHGRGVGLSPWVWAGGALFALAYLQLMVGPDVRPKSRALLAVVFGLVHGFGFAGAFAGLPAAGDGLLAAVLGFNVGVELGQLLALAAAWMAGSWLIRLAGRRRITEPLSLAVAAAGAWVFVLRGLG